MTGPPVVEARRLTRRYGDQVACDEVDLVVRAGEIVGICGPSGSGKSTLLRLLAGQEPADAGELSLGGVQTLRGRRRVSKAPRPAYVMPVFQDPVGSLNARWPLWRCVTEPLMAPHRRPHPSRADRRELAATSLHRVGLGRLDLSTRPAELSVGQCQRASIMRAVLAEPALVLADEPTSALDVTATAGVLRIIAELATAGTAVIVVSHDEVLLDVLADRVLYMQSGQLKTAPAPADDADRRDPLTTSVG